MTEQGTSFWEKYSMQISIVAAALILGGAFYFGGNAAPRAADTENEAPPMMEVDIKNVTTAGSPSIGSPTAPVTMAVWYDYQCPFCKSFELETLSQVKRDYVDTGKLRIVLKDFQFQGPDSTNTALFGRAMWEAYPEHFDEWYVAVAGITDETLPNVKALAAAIDGVDADRVERLMNEKKAEYQAAIDADYDEGARLGIQGTPGSILGKTFINGAQPYDVVKAAIEAELK